MHPDPAFRWDDTAMRAFVGEQGFGALFVTTPDGPRVVHLPVIPTGTDGLGFHLSAANAVTPHLDGARALFVVQGPHAYISPRWYRAGTDEVPTWNYLAVEVEGVVTPLSRAALREQIDALAHAYEPEPQWAVDQIDPVRAESMLDAIRGFVLTPTAWRGTAKLSQNKPAHVRTAAAGALGDHPIAAWMRRIA